MNRGAFALFNWTLRKDAAMLRAHLVRGAFAGIMFLILAAAWFQSLAVGAAGLNLFYAICWMNIVVSTLAAISYFSTSVTEESEGGNLGLLKLAGMGAVSILLGKSTSRLIGALMLLVVQFPFTLLAITLGGVTLVQILTAYCAIGAHLVLVANLALFFSVFCRTSGRAAAWTACVVAIFFGGLPLLQFAGAGLPAGASNIVDRWESIQQSMSVVVRVRVALEPAFAGAVVNEQATMSLATALVLFVLSCLGFERATDRQASPQRAVLAKGRAGSWLRVLGVPRAWSRAIAWKEFYYLTGGRVLWVMRAVVFGVLFATIDYYSGSIGLAGSSDASPLMIGCVLVVLGAELVVYAARILFDETRWQTLPLLLILPITPRQLVRQKVLGCFLATIPSLLWLGVALMLHPEGVSDAVKDRGLVYFAVNFALLLHFTVLFSLYLKWAALPAAVCVVFAFNSCCPVMSIGLVLSAITPDTAGVLVMIATFCAYWILLLVPLQVEIISRIEDAGQLGES